MSEQENLEKRISIFLLISNIAAASIVGVIVWAAFNSTFDWRWTMEWDGYAFMFAPVMGTLLPLAALRGWRSLMWAFALAPVASVVNFLLFLALSDPQTKLDEVAPLFLLWLLPLLLLFARIIRKIWQKTVRSTRNAPD